MSTSARPTKQQIHFANHPDDAFLDACPGAGKTRTILDRAARIVKDLPPRHGIAVLSFTNSAVDEFSERCHKAGLERAVQYPSFVGTFDSFIRHFIVLPSGISAGCNTIRPKIVDSWEALGIDPVRISGAGHAGGAGVPLDDFDPSDNAVNPDRVSVPEMREHVRQNRAQYENNAKFKRKYLIKAGYMSAGDARIVALERIRDVQIGKAIGKALKARFAEVVVDEGQDCNPSDVEIIRWLRSHCIRVTVLADIDQAIYGFRHGEPALLNQLRDEYPKGSQLTLTGNFRSSLAICQLAATLRRAGNVDDPLGNSASVTHPVLLIPYSGRTVCADISQKFVSALKKVGIPEEKAIILGHQNKTVQRAVGELWAEEDGGGSRVAEAARIVAEFWATSLRSSHMEQAVRGMERLLLDFSGKREKYESAAQCLDRLETEQQLQKREFRRLALQVLQTTPLSCGDSDGDRTLWISKLRDAIAQSGLVPPAGMTTKKFFQAPREDSWCKVLASSVHIGLRTSTIHEAKGHEYQAVCVVIPPDHAPQNRTSQLIRSWEQKDDEESKRVIYVGVTRGQHLVAIAVPMAFLVRVEKILCDGRVKSEIVSIDESSPARLSRPQRRATSAGI